MLSIDDKTHRSPNFDSRNGAKVALLVLHYTGMKSGAAALDRLCDVSAKVSAHYVVEEEGRIFCLVDEEYRAWHAGVSYWRGIENVNAASIGIEIVNPGHEYGYRAFPDAQIASVIELCRDITKRYNISPRNVVGHSDVAPERKEDPGELFPWDRLALNGVGAWPHEVGGSKGIGFGNQDPANNIVIPAKAGISAVGSEKKIPAFAGMTTLKNSPLAGESQSGSDAVGGLSNNSTPPHGSPSAHLLPRGGGSKTPSTINHQPYSIENVQSGLIEYGYHLRKTRMWDEATKKVIIAFQRHFRPRDFSGEWDDECEFILQQLLKQPDFFTA